MSLTCKPPLLSLDLDLEGLLSLLLTLLLSLDLDLEGALPLCREREELAERRWWRRGDRDRERDRDIGL